ncbi:MAG TPA: GatB/YqeY domain-containing protein [Burkholderiales bacterium]|nr:GatB/YqeY domain-containing protein [Burkholderiales bacterium]
MSLKTRITDDMKNAMKAKDAQRLGALRLLLAAVKQREVDERTELTDTDVIAVIDKMLKQRRDSIAQYQAAGRQDLADQERFEVGVLSAYMPEQADDSAIAAEIDAAIQATGAKGPADMGKVMGAVKAKLAGRADMARVSAQVKARLTA